MAGSRKERRDCRSVGVGHPGVNVARICGDTLCQHSIARMLNVSPEYVACVWLQSADHPDEDSSTLLAHSVDDAPCLFKDQNIM